MSTQNESRGGFSGSLGYVLAAAGAAVGLGNIWKFPYLAGSSGGGVFLVIYLVVVLVVGVPLLIAETSVGRHGQGDAYTSFYRIAKEQGNRNPKVWGLIGFIGTLCGMAIYTYYVVIGGWVADYIVKVVTEPLESLNGEAFGAFISQPFEPIICTIVFSALTFIVVFGGVQQGIEKAAKIMMPVLFILLIAIVIRVVTLPGAVDGLKYLFIPNMTRVAAAGGLGKVALSAMSQAFWSLSLAQGIMIIYGSYQKKSDSIVKNSLSVAGLDTMVALLAGMAVLGAVFAFGQEPAAGPGLLFGTLTMAFSTMGAVGGKVFGCMFFVTVLLAALTSSVSLLEVATSFLTETCHLPRRKALIGFALVGFVISALASLSNGALSGVTIGGLSIFDALGFFAETLLLPIAGFTCSLFVGWVWKPQNALKEITNEGTIRFKLGSLWGILIKYILPIGIAYIFISGITA